MSDESVSKLCPCCAMPVPTEAPGGLCPKCLMVQAAVGTGGDGLSTEAKTPPSLKKVAAAFPQLEVLEMVGQGGMGVVFKARQPKLDRLVALKILPEQLAGDPAFAARFAREGQMLARLSHPNVVGVYDFGESGGFFYLLMEYVDGVNLRQALRSGQIAADQALAIVPKICEALQYAHEEGVLHRDIKPENILLDTKGRVKIADFGIAKFAGDAKGTRLTAAGAALGTPHYVAPEQIERPSEVDHRADIYSLGVVFYEMLTGELPLGRFAPPSEKSSVDPRVDEVVLRALEKERDRRQQSASEVRTQVETLSAKVPAKPKKHGRTARPAIGRWLTLGLLLVVPFVAMLIFFGGGLLLYLSRGIDNPIGHFRHTNLRLDEEAFEFYYTCEVPEGWQIVLKTREYGESQAEGESVTLLRENVTPLDAAGKFRLDVSHLQLAGEEFNRAQASIGPSEGWACRLRPHKGFALMHTDDDRMVVTVEMVLRSTIVDIAEETKSP